MMEEEKKFQHYELMYIVSANYTADEIPKITEKVRELLLSNGARVTAEDTLGKLKLAYPIKKALHGYYQIAEFDLETKNLKKLENELRLMAEVLRHQAVIKRVKTPEEIAAEKVSRERQARAAEEELKQELEGQEKEKKIEKREKVSIEDLDKKIDELIDESVL